MIDPVLPFGKYRGLRVSEVPTQYLDWCLREVKSLEGYLRGAMRSELARRNAYRPPPDEPRASF